MTPAIVLTAGLGTRLDPLTRLVAKAAVPVGGSTLVERILAWLRDQGIVEVVLNLHHRPETITRVAGDGAHLGLRVRYSWERRVLGSAGGPRRALALLDASDVVIVNGDTLTDVPIAAVLDAHRGRDADATLAVVENPAPDHYSALDVDAAGAVTGLVPAGRRPAGWHFVGVQAVRSSVFDGVADGARADSVSGVYLRRIAEAPGRVRAYRTSARFFDIGTPADYLETVLAIAGAARAVEGRVAPGAEVIESVVWPDASVASGARLTRCIVASAEVPPGLTAREAVIVPASAARPDEASAIAGGVAVLPLHRGRGADGGSG